MKKALIALSLSAVFLFAASLVFADADGAAELYKKQCLSCHGDDGAKTPAGAAVLKGQKAEELAKKLASYKNDPAFGGKSKAMMENIAHKLDDAQIKALADHISKF